MSPNAGWRGPRIVAPLTPNREQELIGGLKNALDRGESLEKAKQSFLNAGYKSNEINAAVQKMPMANSQIVKPAEPKNKIKALIPQPQIQPKQEMKPVVQSSTTTTNPPVQPKEASKTFIIILISLAVIVLIGAGFLGLFWDRLF
jgi:hypothetical protein